MKFAFVFLCTCVVISHQQFQRQRAVFWFSPDYNSPQSVLKSDPAFRYNDLPYLNAELNRELLDSRDHSDDIQYQSRIRGSLSQEQVNPRFFFASNPFLGSSSALPTIMSMVTTVATTVNCVPPFQFLAVPPPPCTGRKRRESDDMASEDDQFPIVPTATLKLTPTRLLRGGRQLSADKSVSDILLPTKDDVIHGEARNDHQMTSRDKRFFLSNGILGGGILANGLFGGSATSMASAVTSYAFVPFTLTQTVNLVDPVPAIQCVVGTDGGCAACLPAGYILCAA